MKTVVETIICDGCGADISSVDSPMPAQYILELRASEIGRNSSGIIYSLAMAPPIDRVYHFCAGKRPRDYQKCLALWIAKAPTP